MLAEDYTKNYVGKIFYFCLRKTGSEAEAEDLTSDISLNILSALGKGAAPENFPAWVWRIVRNRYSAWAERKHFTREAMSDADIGEHDIRSDESIEERFIEKEQLALLRRELAFISRDYREYIIAYYIEDRSIKEISAMLGAAEGTVKSKLFRARNILKEGMDMAREFGVMSYKPENVNFSACGSGMPWNLMNRSLCKNILLAAYRTPSTAHELAIELGVSLPYMEEELNELTKAALLKKSGEKYETTFFIVSANAQRKIFNKLRETAPELTSALTGAIDLWVKCADENGVVWHEGYQPHEDMKWTLLMIAADRATWSSEAASAEDDDGFTLRPDGSRWDVLGFENYEGDKPVFVGLHGSCDAPADADIHFGQFKLKYKGLDQKTPEHITYEDSRAISAVSDAINAKGKDCPGVSADEVPDVPKYVLDRLTEYGYLKRDGEKYAPTFFITYKSKLRDIPFSEEEKKEYDKLIKKSVDSITEYYDFCRNVIRSEVPEFLRGDQHQLDFACRYVMEIRGAVLEEALRTGYISYEENERNGMLGAYMVKN